MKTVVDKANTRGYANHGWLKTHHTFSFANYYNPKRVHFGMLRVLNDDSVAPGEGFDTHPHKNMEVIDSREVNVENSIDQYFYEEDGKYYMLWGSFFGIYIMELDVTDDVMITPKLDTKRQIAGNAYEGINLWKRDGYYYLIGSIGSCCEGQKSTYTTVVARSKDLFGPYVDKQGGQMLDNKHEVILHKNDRFVGTGHNSTLLEDDEKNTWMLYHAFELERFGCATASFVGPHFVG